MAVPKGEEREKRAEIFEEIVTKNVSNLMKYINLYIQEVLQTPNRRNSVKFTLRHIFIKQFKDKERILKEARTK